MELTVMTFNLRVNTPVDGSNAWPYRSKQAAELIRRVAPLVASTQEGKYDMLRDLDRELSEYSRIGEGRSGYESGDEAMDECCCIYYRHDDVVLLKHGQFWLSETPDEAGSVSWDSSLPRFCTWGLFQLKEKPDLQFYLFNTHFDHIGQEARVESAKLLLQKIGESRQGRKVPAVVTGDFNCYPDNPAIALLKNQLNDAYDILGEPVGRTFHEFAGGIEGEPIDYIFTSEDMAILETIVYRDEQDGAYPSDHYPIASRVQLP
ncbi:endonuclease/exonuclease/phosphatase family protein [Paenibacillus chungangensis]|uniref:Endonuclease/exonuclease/phosphatase family protein n=1 Tax=Paenibacillus chungangensis TaxID=696535 RepID=A0ABW3HW35_9BACL